MGSPDDFGGVGSGLAKKHPAGPAFIITAIAPHRATVAFSPSRPAGALPLIRDFALHPRGDMAAMAEGEFWQFVDEVSVQT